MTIEERLAEIQARAELSKPIGVIEYSYTYYYLRDVPWLLELVQDQKEQSDFRDDHIRILEKQVRELERHFSDEADSEHVSTAGDLL